MYACVSVCYVYVSVYYACLCYTYVSVCMSTCMYVSVISACVSVHMLYIHAVVPGLNIRLPVSRVPSVTGNSLSLLFITKDAE